MIFRNRWAALFFVALTILSAMSLVGTSDGRGALSEMERDITQQRNGFDEVVGGLGETGLDAAEDIDVEFATNEEWIDAADGLDPFPQLREETIAPQGIRIVVTHPGESN